MKEYKKLVRDNIPEIMRKNGAIPVTRILEKEEYQKELDKKLQEEVKEYLASHEIEELADILEVLYAIVEDQGSTREEVETIRIEKQKKRGAFQKKIFLEKEE